MDFWVDLVLLSRQDISGLYMFKQKVNHASQFCFLASASELFAQNRHASSSVDFATTVRFHKHLSSVGFKILAVGPTD